MELSEYDYKKPQLVFNIIDILVANFLKRAHNFFSDIKHSMFLIKTLKGFKSWLVSKW